MIEPQFTIYGAKADGSKDELFRWCRSARTGVARAEREAEDFGIADRYTHYVAVPIDPNDLEGLAQCVQLDAERIGVNPADYLMAVQA